MSSFFLRSECCPLLVSLFRGVTAACRTPELNVGNRQNGRETPPSVVTCGHGDGDVGAALREALSLDLDTLTHPYGDDDTGPRVAELLATLPFDAVKVRKRNTY